MIQQFGFETNPGNGEKYTKHPGGSGSHSITCHNIFENHDYPGLLVVMVEKGAKLL
jgi:hypothetical protein